MVRARGCVGLCVWGEGRGVEGRGVTNAQRRKDIGYTTVPFFFV